MGVWQLEVFRMALYLAVPLGIFHVFNQPAYFEEWVIKTKREIYPPVDPKMEELLENTKREFRRKENLKIIAALEEAERHEKA